MSSPSAIRANPFYQPPRQWQLRILTQRVWADAIEEAFADQALAVSSFEADEDSIDWVVDVLLAEEPAAEDIRSRLTLIAGLSDTQTARYELRELQAHDWVSEVERSFPPLCVGRFYVHGSHVAKPPPHGKIALRINAGGAFGSGEHATTSGCLHALTLLVKRKRFLRPLDMGCGSGILAIAMAKLWRTNVIGVDIDPVSVAVACVNARENQVAALTDFAAGDGYAASLVRTRAPFDLIVANILARPLVRMAPALARHLAPGGIAVLSGLLVSQETMVLAAHRAQGLRLTYRLREKGWSVLVLQR